MKRSAGRKNLKCVSEWGENDVQAWLADNGLAEYYHLLVEEHHVSGLVLLTLTERDLKEPPLQIPVLGDLKRLSVALKRLQLHNLSDVAELSALPATGDGQTPPRITHEHEYATTNAASIDGQQAERRFPPQVWKTAIAFVYSCVAFVITSLVMVIVHDRVPDMERYPPLPDLVLDMLPFIPWAFDMCEFTALVLAAIFVTILVFHKHRLIVMRRLFSLSGTIFLLRCVCMLLTSMSVPGVHLHCEKMAEEYGTGFYAQLQRALFIASGFGMSLNGVRTCGDYMFSGHTVIVTLLNHFITEYTRNNPTFDYFLHTTSWLLNMFGIFFILAAHEHYSIDVFVGFYITSRLFLYYHTLANNRGLVECERTRIYFPLFWFFESGVDGPVPNVFEWPIVFRWCRGRPSGKGDEEEKVVRNGKTDAAAKKHA